MTKLAEVDKTSSVTPKFDENIFTHVPVDEGEVAVEGPLEVEEGLKESELVPSNVESLKLPEGLKQRTPSLLHKVEAALPLAQQSGTPQPL